MKNLLVLLLIVCGLILTSATQDQSQETLIGKWNYTVNEAPEGLETGSISFFESGEIIGGKVRAKNGSEMQLLDVKLDGNLLTFGLYVDTDYVTVKATIDGDKIKGKVNSPDGEQDIEARKAVQ